jgi:transposase
MFFREKCTNGRRYLQLVENRREDGRSRQHVIATLGRMEELESSGQLASLLASGARFTQAAMVLSAHRQGEDTQASNQHVGPSLVFARLWKEIGCQAVVDQLLRGRAFGFPVERAILLTVIHRLMSPGSDRAASHWMTDHALEGANSLSLHHLYRAMAWLGEVLGDDEQDGRTPFAPRITKDLIEEGLFEKRRNLFANLDIVFFDTTSIYFEGEGGETIGQRGHSKDSRPDLKQMVVGAVVDSNGVPLCCELWPGNTSDVKSLLPIVARLRKRFRVGRICIVADRGMIDTSVTEALETDPDLRMDYILGARMRSCSEVKKVVLARPGRYRIVHPEREKAKDPSPLKVKEVHVGNHRYIVCLNPEQARKDQHDRVAILASLQEKLKQGAKSLVGNRGYRRFITGEGASFKVDQAAIAREKRYDGKWVLRTTMNLSPEDVAMRYKQLWRVEALFRSAKSLLETRPIYHKCDDTIRGHVFCSFLALMLRKELQDRLTAKGCYIEWADLVEDLDKVQETTLEQDGKCFIVRSDMPSIAIKAFQAVGVAIPPRIRAVEVPVT